VQHAGKPLNETYAPLRPRWRVMHFCSYGLPADARECGGTGATGTRVCPARPRLRTHWHSPRSRWVPRAAKNNSLGKSFGRHIRFGNFSTVPVFPRAAIEPPA